MAFTVLTLVLALCGLDVCVCRRGLDADVAAHVACSLKLEALSRALCLHLPITPEAAAVD